MSTEAIVVIVVLVLLFGGGGYYWRSRRGWMARTKDSFQARLWELAVNSAGNSVWFRLLRPIGGVKEAQASCGWNPRTPVSRVRRNYTTGSN